MFYPLCTRYSTHPWYHEGVYLLKVAELEFVLGIEADCRRHLDKALKVLTASAGQDSVHARRAKDMLDMLSSPTKDSPPI